MNFFQERTEKDLPDVKMIRENTMLFIKERLGKLEGGEGKNIKGVQIFISSGNEDKHIYESVFYINEEDRFKNEVQRIADDYAIQLPKDWAMEINFVDEIPEGATKMASLPVGLFIRTQKRVLTKSATAYLRVMNGEAEKEVYTIKSTDGKITMGRERKVQGEDGFFRINTVAFPGASLHESNKYISREHAHIQFDHDSGQFYLYADESGIPPRNKIKVRSTNEIPVKLYSTQIGHPLKEGDQIMLGESAILEFSYLQNES